MNKFFWLTMWHTFFKDSDHKMISRKPLYLKHELHHCTCGYLDPTDWHGRPPESWNRK